MKILARVTQKRSSLFIGYVFLGLHTEDLVELVTSVSDFEQIPELAGCIVGSRLQSPVEVVEFSRRQSRVSGCLFFAADVIYIAQTSFSLWSILRHIGRNQERMSKHFERWKELAALTSKEQDPVRLTELASEMNLVLAQKTPYLDPPLREPLD